jgi:2-polyprenyl-3-methyl-5-hydroxy-6-metoxy-1,4-benzoquinol methylase
MQYDPVKDKILSMIEKIPVLRTAFFKALDMLFLRQWYVKRTIQNLYPPDKEIHFLDAGAGFCQYSDHMLKRWNNSKVLAIDLKTDYLKQYGEYAAKRFKERFEWLQADLVTFDTENKFDLIVAIDILEHIENDRQVLQNFHKFLKAGGNLIISTPSDKDETARFTAEHVRPGYNETELKSKLTESGFMIKQFTYSYGKMGYLSWKLAIKYPLTLLSKSKIYILLLPFYYIALYIPIYLLMLIDISAYNKTGNGIIAVAGK